MYYVDIFPQRLPTRIPVSPKYRISTGLLAAQYGGVAVD